jgi:hypothetical protein
MAAAPVFVRGVTIKLAGDANRPDFEEFSRLIKETKFHDSEHVSCFVRYRYQVGRKVQSEKGKLKGEGESVMWWMERGGEGLIGAGCKASLVVPRRRRRGPLQYVAYLAGVVCQLLFRITRVLSVSMTDVRMSMIRSGRDI